MTALNISAFEKLIHLQHYDPVSQQSTLILTSTYSGEISVTQNLIFHRLLSPQHKPW